MKRDFTLSQDLRLNTQRLGPDAWVLSPFGAIDSSNSDDFKNRIEKFIEENRPVPNVLLDVSGVKYTSSIGLGALIHLQKRTQQGGTSFGLYNPQLAVRRVLEISKLDFLLVKPEDTAKLGPFAEYVSRKEAERAAVPPGKKN